MDRSVRLASLSIGGVALGAVLAMIVPTEMKVARNAQLEALSQPRIVSYPAPEMPSSLPDSYPVTYSRQWLAVAEGAERQRMARYAMPELPLPTGYDQPPPERDLAVEREGPGDSEAEADEDSDGESSST